MTHEIECPRCNGEGGWIAYTTGYAEPVDHMAVCEKCEGSGKIELTDQEYWDQALETEEGDSNDD
jgi:DnaJ-class molecular chaperone